MTRRLIPAVGAVVALLLAACTSGPDSHERWLRSHHMVAAATSAELPTRKLGDRPAWHVLATLTPEAVVADMAALSAEWPARAEDSQLTLRRPASEDRPELSFTAWPYAGRTETRWEIFALLQSTWPKAAVAIGEDQTAIVRHEDCDPWEELARIDVADTLGRQYGVPITMDCHAGGRVELSRGSVLTTGDLTGLRDRAQAVLAQLPTETPWTARADKPGRAVRIEVSTRDIPARPTSAVLSEQDAELTIKPTEPAGRVEVTVTGASDLREVARAAAELTWLDRIKVDARQRSVELRGDLGHIREVVPLAERHPDLAWWLAQSGAGQRNWVRAPGAEFGERARQYQALVGSGVQWSSVVLHQNQGLRTFSLEIADPGDWRRVASTVRGVRWQGDMRIEIGSRYPGVAFTSTATGPARDTEVANNQVPPDPQRHPELIEIVEAWDVTAS